jgi:hypothetical protein
MDSTDKKLTDAERHQAAAEFFSTILQAGVITHQLHLATNSFAKHMALDELYKALPELADDIIEAWQGRNRVVLSYPKPYELKVDDEVTYVMDLAAYVQGHRAEISQASEVQNLIDELAGALDSALYKLRFLN